jgi:iron complex transport system substrate-binding protein
MAPESKMRICSLLPSATEVLFALGLGDSVAGVTHECDFPPEAARKPALISPRVDPHAKSDDLDRSVRELMARSESLYAVRDDLLREIQPDLIITQDLCHVCAASPDDLASALAKMPKQPRILTLQPHTLADVWNDIRRIGDATGKSREADVFAQRQEQKVAVIREKVSAAPSRPRVACIEWLDPIYVGGHWVPEMVEAAGGVDVLGHAGQPSFTVTSEQVIAAKPDVIVIMPCGFSVKRTDDELRRTPLPPEWNQLAAVRDDRVFIVDANSYFSRSGPRLADGVAILANLLHPNVAVGPPRRTPALALGVSYPRDSFAGSNTGKK